MSASAAEVGRKVICADGWRVTMHVEVRRGLLQGPDNERQEPTNRMSAAMFSGSPHSTRTSNLTEPSTKSPQKQPTKQQEREPLTALVDRSKAAGSTRPSPPHYSRQEPPPSFSKRSDAQIPRQSCCFGVGPHLPRPPCQAGRVACSCLSDLSVNETRPDGGSVRKPR
jgi:hypothetical protein